MREILFRGKRIDNGEWIEGCYCRCIEALGMKISKPAIQETDENGLYFREIAPKTLGQFTGLCDKNGKKIFEGDIVNRVADNENGLIVCDDKRCGFYIKPLSILGRAMYDPYYKMNANKLEIIGNIHDNPELYSNN